MSLSAWAVGEVLQGSVKFAKLQYDLSGWWLRSGKGDPWQGREGTERLGCGAGSLQGQ